MKIKTRTRKEVIQRWIKALRSGKYKQGKYKLRSHENTFCCLGVLCDLAAKDGGPKWQFHGEEGYEYHERSGSLFLKLEAFLFRDAPIGQMDLIKLNDGHNRNFEQIANIIEKKLLWPLLTSADML